MHEQKGGNLNQAFRVCTALALSGVLLISACKRSKPPEQQRYAIKGKVESVEKQLSQATIEHEEIPGFMPAMTMPYTVKEPWAMNVLEKGDVVSATLIVEGEKSWLEEIVITKNGSAADASASRPGQPVPGAEVPDFELINQDGRAIHLREYRGRALLLTFIYTRCPLPDFCPLMTAKFAEIQTALKPQTDLYQRTHLLSISVDPEYDRPAVLKAFGVTHAPGGKAQFAHWEFASGSAQQVKAVADYFGLQYKQDTDQIIHSLVTALVGPDGKLIKLYAGNEWKPTEVLEEMRRIQY
jgi:protein SCO1